MSGFFNFFKIQYELGLKIERLKTAVVKKYINTDEYKTITGEEYE